MGKNLVEPQFTAAEVLNTPAVTETVWKRNTVERLGELIMHGKVWLLR